MLKGSRGHSYIEECPLTVNVPNQLETYSGMSLSLNHEVKSRLIP